MATDTRSSHDIERDLEQERQELRGTIDEIWNRLTFEDAWNRVGRYVRENGNEHGKTLGRLVQEKPIAAGLTLVGVTWLLFGPGSNPPRRSETARYSRGDALGDPHQEELRRRARLADAEAERRAEM